MNNKELKVRLLSRILLVDATLTTNILFLIGREHAALTELGKSCYLPNTEFNLELVKKLH